MHEFRMAVKNSENIILDSCAQEFLRSMMQCLEAGEPRQIPCADLRKPALVFTDGGHEIEGYTIGGMIRFDGEFE